MNKILAKAILTIFFVIPLFATDSEEVTTGEPLVIESGIAVCNAPTSNVSNPSFISYFSGLFSTENWPARWTCGEWSQVEGWLYISSDLSIFLAYLSIPIMLLWFVRKRNLGRARGLVTLFAAFILLCGFTHLIDVVLFWEPMYRLSGFAKLLTGIVSIGTATVLGFVIPRALEYKSPSELQAEIDERKKVQSQFETFVKYAPGAIAMLDTEKRFMIANDGYYEAYYIQGQDIIGKRIQEVFPTLLETNEWMDRFDLVLTGEKLSKEADMFEVEGQVGYFNWKLEPWYDPDGHVGGVMIFTEIITESVLRKKKLVESELKFTNIFNKAQFAIALVGEGGVPFLVNHQFCQLLDYSEEELTSMSFEEFTHPEDVQKDVERYHLLLKDEIDSYTIDKRYITKSGDIKYVKLNVTLVDEGTEEVYALAIVEDITETEKALKKKKQSERKMREMNESFLEISSMANIGTWEVDVSDNKCYWSETVYNIHEEDASKEIHVEEAIKYYHPDYREIISKAVEDAIANQKSWDLELKIITAKGNERWVRAVGRPIFKHDKVLKLQGLFQDIHEKVVAQIQLNEKAEGLKILNQRFDLAQKAASLGIWDWDIKLNELTWDDFMYRIYGIQKKDFTSCYEAWQSGVHPKDKERSHKEVQESLEKGKKFDTQFRVVWPNGDIRHVKALGEVFRDKAGDPVRMIGINWDITEEVQQELKIRELNKTLKSKVDERTLDLKTANEELEAFSYSVSHDLRAPLRAINGFAEALIEDYARDMPEDAQGYLSRISANSYKMGTLIDDLLEFSRMNRKQVNHAEVDLNQLVLKLIDDVFLENKEKIKLSDLPVIIGDEQMLDQVFTNLLSNALKYSSKEEKPEIHVSAMQEEDFVVVSVQDNGVGFNMDYYNKLFNVFQRLHTESEFEGTGVGLSLCAKIMKAHDGEIWAEAKEGEGATFYLKFKQPN